MTNEEAVNLLVISAITLGKRYERFGEKTRPSYKAELEMLEEKNKVLDRMKPDTEIVPGVASEPFTTTPQPPGDPDDDDPCLLRITKNPFEEEGDDGPG